MINLIGQRFHYLLVIERVENYKSGHPVYNCLCKCGNYKNIRGDLLRNGQIKSCGCYRQEVITTHGHSKGYKVTKEYSAWASMIARCKSTTVKNKEYYLDKGIKVYEPWVKDFSLFLEHIGPCPNPKFSIDRIDPAGNYEPGNVRWANTITQSTNQGKRKDNTSGVKGVDFHKSSQKWQARISINKKRISLGYFNTKEEAIQARLDAETRFYNNIYNLLNKGN